MTLAASAFGSPLLVVIFFGILLWIAVFVSVFRDRRQSAPVPANLRPYYEDDVLETSRLERMLQIAVVVLFLTGIVMAVYFVEVPSIQKKRYDRLEEEAIERGAKIFGPVEEERIVDGKKEKHPIAGAFGCQNCHGAAAFDEKTGKWTGGGGGSAAYSITQPDGTVKKVTWKAPSLNDVFLRFSDESVRTILTYGRPGSPMPAWGTAGGGAMNDQQIEDTMTFLHQIQKPQEEVQKKNAELGTDGATLFNAMCARCHTIGWSWGEPQAAGSGGYGPSLLDGASVLQFPNAADQVKFVTEGDAWQKPYGVRGVGQGRMPGFGKMLSQEQIAAIVAYERTLPGRPGTTIGK